MLEISKTQEKSLENSSFFQIGGIARLKEKVGIRALMILGLVTFYTPNSLAYENNFEPLDRMETYVYVKESLTRLNGSVNLGDLSVGLNNLKQRLELVKQELAMGGKLDAESLKIYWELINKYYEKVSPFFDTNDFENDLEKIYGKNNFGIIVKEAGTLYKLIEEITELLTDITQLSEQNEGSGFSSIAKVEVKRGDTLIGILISQFRMPQTEALTYLRFYGNDIKTINLLRSINSLEPGRIIILPNL